MTNKQAHLKQTRDRDSIPAKERVGACCMPTGIVYYDKTVEIDRDYKRLAILFYDSMEKHLEPMAAYLRAYILNDMSQYKYGTPFNHAGNSTITWGHDLRFIIAIAEASSAIGERYLFSRHGQFGDNVAVAYRFATPEMAYQFAKEYSGSKVKPVVVRGGFAKLIVGVTL